jgi:hypothetical protein
MTLITGYRLKVGGFLQADILLTSKKDTLMPPAQIPSCSFNVDNPSLGDRTVVGLCQKILILNEHFAVAFAGSISSIQAAALLLDALCAKYPKLTGKRFIDALSADEILAKSRLEAIVLSVEGGEIKIWDHGTECERLNSFFDLHVGGSGFAHAIAHFDRYPPELFDVPEDEIVVQGTCMALEQFAYYLIEEFETKLESKTISEYFGGGYEVVAFYSDKFHRISDVVYAYAEAEIDTDGILQVDFPKFLLKSAYQDDDLKIRSVEIYYDEDEEAHTARNDRTFTIAPVTRYHETRVEEGGESIKFMGEFLCFMIKVKRSGGNFIIPFIRKYDQNFGFLAKAFFASVSKGNVQFLYSNVFSKEMEAHVLKYIELRCS